MFKSELDLEPRKIESLMPPQVIFGLYSAASLYYKKEPADYDHIYIYSNEANFEEVLKRLLSIDKKRKNYNLFIVKKDKWLGRYKNFPWEQIFVDIWNAPEWYAKDFLAAIENKLPFHE